MPRHLDEQQQAREGAVIAARIQLSLPDVFGSVNAINVDDLIALAEYILNGVPDNTVADPSEGEEQDVEEGDVDVAMPGPGVPQYAYHNPGQVATWPAPASVAISGTTTLTTADANIQSTLRDMAADHDRAWQRRAYDLADEDSGGGTPESMDGERS